MLFWGLRSAATTTSSKSRRGPLDDLEVPVVEGVEGSREKADFHESSPLR